MHSIIQSLAFSIIILLSACSESAPADAGKLRILADQKPAYIYINGQKKAMIGDEGFTNILLAEGEYTVKVEKNSDDGQWVFSKERIVFVGADSSVKLNFELEKAPSKMRIATQEKELKEMKKQAEERYTSNDQDGTVTEKKTGLMWKRCLEGQAWTGSACSGDTKHYKWLEAQAQARYTSFAGYNDWRVPTIDELSSIVVCAKGRRAFQRDRQGKSTELNGESQNGSCLGNYQRPTINQVLFPDSPDLSVWSSSPRADISDRAWSVNFGGGNAYGNVQRYGLRVRLVRSRQ